jgi:PBSX family phage terminase large subunit
MSEQQLQRLIETANKAGSPSDQIKNFLKKGYVPQPKQWEFHAACRRADEPGQPNEIALGGARGPGKSHALFCQIALDDCQRFPNLKVLYLRKVLTAGKEAMNDLSRKTLQYVPHETRTSPTYLIIFPNGSKIQVGNYRDNRDIEKYQGLEYDLLVIEEATQLHDEQINMLKGSLRSTRTDYRQRVYYSTNPGGVGHQWFRKKFVLPERSGAEAMKKRNVWFIPANYKDNAFLPPEYIAILLDYTGILGRMWRDGDWEVGAGTFFTTFSEDHHVIAPFKIPSHWRVWASFDYGFTHPTVFQLHTASPHGQIYTIAEHSRNQLRPSEHYSLINELTQAVAGRPIHHLDKIYAGHDIFAQKGDGRAETIHRQYQNLGMDMIRATISRIQGHATMLELLGDPLGAVYKPPGWQIFSTCAQLIDTIPAMQVDPHRPEDIAKINADEHGLGGDDSCDCARYGLHIRKPRDIHHKNRQVTKSMNANQYSRMKGVINDRRRSNNIRKSNGAARPGRFNSGVVANKPKIR